MTTTQERLQARDDRTSRPARRWARTVAAVVALALAGAAAAVLADFEWDRVVEYDSPYAFNLAPASETPTLADRAILVVVDGLRADAADLPTLRRLGQEGSFLTARAVEPSLSFPGWTTLLTGAPPEISGVTTNWYDGRVRVDSLLASARRAGLTTAVAGGEGWEQLFGRHVDEGFYVADRTRLADRRVARAAVRMLEQAEPHLLVVHLPDVDHRAHESGVGSSYRRAARRADAVVARLVEAAPPGTAVVVTSDHGHIDAGGHGGPEEEVTLTPLILWGDGLVPGARGMVAQSEVAPTIAALLGIGRPAHAIGDLRVELLDAADAARSEIGRAHEEAARRFYAEATRVLGGTGATEASFEAAREARLRHDVLARLPLAVGVIAALALAVALATQRLDAVAILAGAVSFFAAWAGIFVARGLSFSFSHFNTEEQVASFLTMRVVDTLIALAVAAVVMGVVAGRRQRAGGFRTALGMAAWIMLVAAMGVAAFVTLFGWGFTWRLPHLAAAFAQLLALVAVFGIGVAAGAAALLALGTATLVAPRHRAGSRGGGVGRVGSR